MSTVRSESAMHRHRLDPVSLLFGLLFTALGAVFLLADVRLFQVLDLRWFAPLVVLALGLWLLLSAGLSGRDRRAVAPAASPQRDAGDIADGEDDEEGARAGDRPPAG